MTVAVLSDIHGNAAALEAVLEDLAATRPERILLNGDLLAIGPEPAETLALLRRLEAPSTRGNTDRWLADAARAVRSAGVPDEVYESLLWTAGQLGSGELRALGELPLALAAEPLPVQLYHASAAGDEEGVWPNTPDGEIPALFPGLAVRTVVVGHTHRPGERSADGLRVLNAGSVGLPFDGDSRACYLLLAGEPGRDEVRAEWRRIAYDRERALRAIREREVPMATRLSARIRTGEF